MNDIKDGNYTLPNVRYIEFSFDDSNIKLMNVEVSFKLSDDGKTLKVFADTPIPEKAFDY